MASTTGTMRGTPSRSGQARGQLPVFSNSPASNIPRPAQDSHATHATHATTPNTQSEVGGSSMSASRAKQSKRDEVCYILFILWFHIVPLFVFINPGVEIQKI